MNINAAGAATAAASPQPRDGAKLGKDQFLQLLVAQLRNQDPMNPSDPREFASQLAQFTSLEQLMNIGENLSNMTSTNLALIELTNANSAVGVLGKGILATGDQLVVPEDGVASVTFDVGATGGTARLRILDEAGKEVGSRDLGFVGAGRGTAELGSAGEGLPPGTYRYVVDVIQDGTAVPVQTYTAGVVTGVQYTSAGPILKCGALTVPLSSVVEIIADKH